MRPPNPKVLKILENSLLQVMGPNLNPLPIFQDFSRHMHFLEMREQIKILMDLKFRLPLLEMIIENSDFIRDWRFELRGELYKDNEVILHPTGDKILLLIEKHRSRIFSYPDLMLQFKRIVEELCRDPEIAGEYNKIMGARKEHQRIFNELAEREGMKAALAFSNQALEAEKAELAKQGRQLEPLYPAFNPVLGPPVTDEEWQTLWCRASSAASEESAAKPKKPQA